MIQREEIIKLFDHLVLLESECFDYRLQYSGGLTVLPMGGRGVMYVYMRILPRLGSSMTVNLGRWPPAGYLGPTFLSEQVPDYLVSSTGVYYHRLPVTFNLHSSPR